MAAKLGNLKTAQMVKYTNLTLCTVQWEILTNGKVDKLDEPA